MSENYILDEIKSPDDVKKLPESSLTELADEIRRTIIDTTSKNGGHLASNLGMVEPSIVLHRVFDCKAGDRLIFDVGHQAYAHKILTGRYESFFTLRKLGGISGMTNRDESEYDTVTSGHSGTSLSTAVGIAESNRISGNKSWVVAVIGDGSFTNGMIYEALNQMAVRRLRLIVILNDNGMSIDGNVGAVSEHLGLLRSKPAYYEFKKAYRDLLDRNAVGRAVYDFNHHLKTNVKKALLPNSTMFEDMGFTYLGPVNGHDVGQLTNTLKWAKDLNCPVLVHVHTKKGKGYPPAEREPERYHGVGKFDPRMGVPREHKRDFSAVFGDELCKLAKNDETICAITAAMRDGTGLHDFSEQYPVRFFDVGIAEGHAVAMAAGMAKQGLTPVVAIYSSFLQRAYDQLIHDTALSDLHVVFAVDRAGMVGADGETHHGIFDATFLSEIPNMTVLCPSNFAELRTMLDRAVNEIKGPVAIRYPRGGEGNYKKDSGRQNLVVLREGADITLCAYGTMINNVLDAAEILHEQGIEARVVKINAISPLYDRDMREVIGKTKAMLVAEECAGVGCMGQRMAAILGWNKISPERLELCNLGKAFPAQGTVEELYREFGLDAESLAKKAAEVLQ